MKKTKILLATAAVATAFTCAIGMTACNKSGNDNTGDTPNGDEQIVAVYQLYSANAQANGETVLTYEQWLESIKGPQGATGADGKSAYEIAVENGFEGSQAEWLESLKGDKGDDGEAGSAGAQGVGVEGIYETSDGLVIKFTDGTVKPVQNGGIEYPLLTVGDHNIEVKGFFDELFADEGQTVFSFYSVTGGTYKITVYSEDVVVCYYDYDMAEPGLDFVFVYLGDPYDGTFDSVSGGWYTTYEFTANKAYTLRVQNYSETNENATYRVTIEKVTD